GFVEGGAPTLRAVVRTLVGLGAGLFCLAAAAPALAANPVQAENLRAGTTAWQVASAGARAQGYTSEISVLPGQLVHFHVRAEAPYSLRIYRLGWYGGRGGRLLAA